MIHSLRALRSDHELLLVTMQVFVKEPSLDWKENAANLARYFGASEANITDNDGSTSQGETLQCPNQQMTDQI